MKSKLACDAETPCDTCLFHARECTREAQQHNLGRTELTPLSKSLPSHDLNLLWLERVTSAPKPELVFDFLLKYTLPSTWSLPGSLGIDIDNKANIGRVSHFCGEPIADESHGETSAYDTGLPFGLDGTRLFASTPGTLTPIQQPFEISAALLSVPETPPMSLYEHIAHGIIDELICFTTQRGTCQLGAVDSLYRFLLSGNLQDHLANYFTRWHRHSPTIHRPSFRLVDTPPSLLLAILLIGASLSSTVEVRSTVDQVVDLAEDYVFDHGHFQDLLSSESKVLCPKQGLHAIQAAHCIVQLQLRSPCNEKRVSIRQERYRQLIDSIQHYNAAHGSSNEACEIDNDTNKAPSWRDFGLVEARKRLTYGIFTIEATFSVFYDLPPRLKLEDLDVGLPCSVEEFMTSSQMRYSLQNELHRPVERLHEILTILFSEQTNFSTLHFYHFDVLQLFILILGKLAFDRFAIHETNCPESCTARDVDVEQVSLPSMLGGVRYCFKKVEKAVGFNQLQHNAYSLRRYARLLQNCCNRILAACNASATEWGFEDLANGRTSCIPGTKS